MNTKQNIIKIEQDKIALQKTLELKRLTNQQDKIRQIQQKKSSPKNSTTI